MRARVMSAARLCGIRANVTMAATVAAMTAITSRSAGSIKDIQAIRRNAHTVQATVTAVIADGSTAAYSSL